MNMNTKTTSEMTNENLSREERRIQELGEKSSQTLLFLSFALVVVATLKDKSDASRQVELQQAMFWWCGRCFLYSLAFCRSKTLERERSGGTR
jgi:hypothetical protein